MPSFDSLIVGDWPKGLYLAQQLSLQGKKTAYLYQRPAVKNPFALFLSESSQTEKQFFNSLGFLEKQEGGFCILTEKGVWPLQKRKELGFAPPAPLTDSFNKDFLFYLSHNLAGKVFEFNDSVFSEPLDLFCDYFLFYPCFKKIALFKQQYPNLHFFEDSDLKPLNKSFSARNRFFFNDCIQQKPYWQWQAFHYELDFLEYKDIIPSHLVCIKNLLLPWCYENLISLFHKNNRAELWMKLRPESPPVKEKVQQTLEAFFPGAAFRLLSQEPLKSFFVYGEESLKKKNSLHSSGLKDFFQGDLSSEIRNEVRYFKELKLE